MLAREPTSQRSVSRFSPTDQPVAVRAIPFLEHLRNFLFGNKLQEPLKFFDRGIRENANDASFAIGGDLWGRDYIGDNELAQMEPSAPTIFPNVAKFERRRVQGCGGQNGPGMSENLRRSGRYCYQRVRIGPLLALQILRDGAQTQEQVRDSGGKRGPQVLRPAPERHHSGSSQ